MESGAATPSARRPRADQRPQRLAYPPPMIIHRTSGQIKEGVTHKGENTPCWVGVMSIHKKGRLGRPDADPFHKTGEVYRPLSPDKASSPTPSGAQGTPGALESLRTPLEPGLRRRSLSNRKAAASELLERTAGRESLGPRRASRPPARRPCPPRRRSLPAKNVMGSPPPR